MIRKPSAPILLTRFRNHTEDFRPSWSRFWRENTERFSEIATEVLRPKVRNLSIPEEANLLAEEIQNGHPTSPQALLALSDMIVRNQKTILSYWKQYDGDYAFHTTGDRKVSVRLSREHMLDLLAGKTIVAEFGNKSKGTWWGDWSEFTRKKDALARRGITYALSKSKHMEMLDNFAEYGPMFEQYKRLCEKYGLPYLALNAMRATSIFTTRDPIYQDYLVGYLTSRSKQNSIYREIFETTTGDTLPTDREGIAQIVADWYAQDQPIT
jgi:hypothetical protein